MYGKPVITKLVTSYRSFLARDVEVKYHAIYDWLSKKYFLIWFMLISMEATQQGLEIMGIFNKK